jgi:hypothetical protein
MIWWHHVMAIWFLINMGVIAILANLRAGVGSQRHGAMRHPRNDGLSQYERARTRAYELRGPRA